jgi:hypothetical protein
LLRIGLFGSLAQNVPNGGLKIGKTALFTKNLFLEYREPGSFYVHTATARDTSDSYSGELALRIETVVIEEDTLFGSTSAR